MKKTTYNGYTNYETWNVALWIDNDQWNNATALQCKDYNEFVNSVETTATGDNIKWTNPLVNVEEINELIFNDK
jgi:hypothetical protein